MDNFKKEFIDDTQTWIWKKWTFDDNGITIEEKPNEDTLKRKGNGSILHCFCSYSRFKEIEFTKFGDKRKGMRVVFYDSKMKEHAFVFVCDKYEHSELKKAIKFAQKQAKIPNDEADYEVFKEVSDNKFDDGEYIKQCQVCGEVFCYTDADLEKNHQIQKEANSLRTKAAIDALGWNPILSAIDSQRADNMLNDLFDYRSCPKCHSQNLKRITKEEFAAIRENEAKPQASNLDEIKKLKELLDLGIITQEEFDTKKKQLLGI